MKTNNKISKIRKSLVLKLISFSDRGIVKYVKIKKI